MRYIYTFFSVIDISLVFYNILFCEYSDCSVNTQTMCGVFVLFTSPIIRDYAPFTVTVLRYGKTRNKYDQKIQQYAVDKCYQNTGC